MKKILVTLALVVMLQSLFIGAASAAYLQSSDKTISINTGLNLKTPLNTGSLTFKLQETVHDTLSSSTGLEIDHYYLWVELDGQQVIGIDPIRAMY
jgi:hypothetical protein